MQLISGAVQPQECRTTVHAISKMLPGRALDLRLVLVWQASV